MSQPLYTSAIETSFSTSKLPFMAPTPEPPRAHPTQVQPSNPTLLHTSGAQTSLRAPAPMPLEIPERMPPPAMPQLGFLSHVNYKEIYGLFGQLRYPNGFQNIWEYYYEPGRGNGGRILLCTAPDRELWDGDGVALPGEVGVWRVNLFKPRYRINDPN